MKQYSNPQREIAQQLIRAVGIDGAIYYAHQNQWEGIVTQIRNPHATAMNRTLTLETGKPARRRSALIGVLVAGIIATAMPSLAAAEIDRATWRPEASERLIKLPGAYLKKAIDHDFAGSELAAALGDVETDINLKNQTLSDLQAATDQANGELRTELQHQFLAEKREYLRLVGERQDLVRRQLNTKIRVYERLLKKLDREGAGMTPAREALQENQKKARERFESSVANVDMQLFGGSAASESKYAREYAKNLMAIATLVQAIKEHPMNTQTEIDGQPVSKQDYLRQLISESESELAVIDQEETILGYMAKLIGLDATALSEEVVEANVTDDDLSSETANITSAVDFFITR